LCTDGDKDCGASDINAGLQDPSSGNCADGALTTAPGGKTLQVARGINGRFNLKTPIGPSAPRNPARNIMEYPQDDPIPISGTLGNGKWNSDAAPPRDYWNDPANPHVSPIDPTSGPPAGVNSLGTLPTRFQMYLYELGETFYVNGKQTAHPLSKPGITTLVRNATEPLNPDVPTDIPPNCDPTSKAAPAAACDMNMAPAPTFTLTCVDSEAGGMFAAFPNYCRAMRRVLTVAVADCTTIIDQGGGKITITGVIQYTRFFIIRQVPTAPTADLQVELLGRVGTSDTGAIHANVRLVE
jgi:hypothetical protein